MLGYLCATSKASLNVLENVLEKIPDKRSWKSRAETFDTCTADHECTLNCTPEVVIIEQLGMKRAKNIYNYLDHGILKIKYIMKTTAMT